MEPSELPQIVKEHQLWLSTGGKEGKRAKLNGADLGNAALTTRFSLERVNLERAVLEGVSFGNSDLTDGNFRGAELRRAAFGTTTLRRTNLREADLQNANLEQAQSLLSTQLAGADVAGAKLPEAIAEFEGLKTIAEATSNAQKLFIAMLGGCLYCWLTIGTTKDAALLTNSASSPLPVIGTALPIVGFYLVAPVVLVALYFYFHLNMQRLWEALADLPAVFPDGRPLDKMADPWLLNGLVRAHFFRLRNERPPLSRLQQWLSILLAWWVVPATLVVFWARFLMRHHSFGTAVHIVLLTAAIGFGWVSYRLACATLRGEPRKSFVWRQAWKDLRTYKRIAGVSAACVFGVILYHISVDAIEGGPSYERHASSLQKVVLRILETIGFSRFANFHGEDVSTKPSTWTGKPEEYLLVKGARLVGARMEYADARDAFLVNAVLSDANLSNANLQDARLDRADLSSTGCFKCVTNLTKANLVSTHFGGANLSRVNLSYANLTSAHLESTKLLDANLTSALLYWADLSNADLTRADLTNAEFVGANLTNANFTFAILKGANFTTEKLGNPPIPKPVNLKNVKGLTKRQLEDAKTDKYTILPEDLPP
jgi:uncharacterized protein YjbI with pentapeptide repeats